MNSSTACHNKVADSNALRRQTFGTRLQSDGNEYQFSFNNTAEGSPINRDRMTSPPSKTSFLYTSTPSPTNCSPSMDMSYSSSPESKFPWSSHMAPESNSQTRLMGSLVRKEGHIYSLAASGDLLYTGSESKCIRVWKKHKEFSGFKSSSGLVKTIIIAGQRIFSGHQDGKIRIWKTSQKDPSLHKRIGTLPTFRAKIKSSFNPAIYVEVRRHHNTIWIKHTDAISCLSLSEDKSLLYSASWDKTFKVWRISDSKCLESINAHEDAVNSIIAANDGLVFTGSADGTVKVWKRQMQAKRTEHFLSQTLLKQECAVTALAVDPYANFLYCGSSDGLVNVWEIAKFLVHGGGLKGHALAVLCLATAGNLVFSGSADTNICVWRREGGEHFCLSFLTGHTGPVKCLAVEEEKGGYWRGGDRQYTVYSGSLDKSVKIWQVSTQAAAMQSLPRKPPQQHHQAEIYNSLQKFSTELLHQK